MTQKVTFRSTTFNLASAPEIFTAIDQASKKNPVRIATLNPEFIEESTINQQFRSALAAMTHCCIDGYGLYLGLRAWKYRTHANTTLDHLPGASLVEQLFERYQAGKKSFFLLGGADGVVEQAAKELLQRYPDLAIAGIAAGGIVLPGQAPDPALLRTIIDSSADILLVGFGAPKQELWINYATDSSIPVMIGVGGTLNFFATKQRAPHWLQQLHLEWLYRGITERGHWKRVFRATIFFSLRTLSWLLRQTP